MSTSDDTDPNRSQQNSNRSLVSVSGTLESLRNILLLMAVVGGLVLSYIMLFVDHGPAYVRYVWDIIVGGYDAKTGFSYYEISKTGHPTKDGRFKIFGSNNIVKLEDLKYGMILKATDSVNIRSSGSKDAKKIGIILIDTCVMVNGDTKVPLPRAPRDPSVLSAGWIMVKKHDCPS